jgi:hypothetical protein
MRAKLAYAALAVLVAVVGCGRNEQRAAPAASLDDQAKLMALQKGCADQAARAFRSADYPKKPNVINTYTNHYAGGRCFMLVDIYDTSEADNASTFETVEDAFEGRRLGSFFIQNAGSAKAGRVATCQEMPVGAPRKSCKSKAEWDAYKARYMDAR